MSARNRRSIGVLSAFFLLLALCVAGGADSASAHDQLVSSSPRSGEYLKAAPKTVTLQFVNPVLTIGAVVKVVDGTGVDWSTGDVALDGSVVTKDLKTDMPDGAYRILWRVVAADGHPISDVVPFTVGKSTTRTPPDGSATSSASPTAAADQARSTGPASRQEPPSPLRPILVGATGASVSLLGFLVGTGCTRRRRSAPPQGPSDPPNSTTNSGGSR